MSDRRAPFGGDSENLGGIDLRDRQAMAGFRPTPRWNRVRCAGYAACYLARRAEPGGLK